MEIDLNGGSLNHITHHCFWWLHCKHYLLQPQPLLLQTWLPPSNICSMVYSEKKSKEIYKMSSRWFQCFIPMHTCLLASTLYPHQHPQPAHNHHHHGNIQKCIQLGWHISQLRIGYYWIILYTQRWLLCMGIMKIRKRHFFLQLLVQRIAYAYAIHGIWCYHKHGHVILCLEPWLEAILIVLLLML